MNKMFVFLVLITTQLKNGQCKNLIPNADFESCNFSGTTNKSFEKVGTGLPEITHWKNPKGNKILSDSVLKPRMRPLKKNELTIGSCLHMNRQLYVIRPLTTYDRFLTIQYSRNLFNISEFSLKGMLSYSLLVNRKVSHISNVLLEIEPSRKWYALIIALGIELMYQPDRMIHSSINYNIYPFEEIEPLFVLKIGNNIRPFDWFIIKPTIELRYGRYSEYDTSNNWIPSLGLQTGLYF